MSPEGRRRAERNRRRTILAAKLAVIGIAVLSAVLLVIAVRQG
ncbi:MAG: hypothetical protein WA842_08720 [Croceibacterium sp.]